MPERLFLFLQFEFPWELGPPDGRYLLRRRAGEEPERVVVLGTLGAARRSSARGQGRSILGRASSRPKPAPSSPEPVAVVTTRATIVDPIPLSAERQAQAWLSELDAEREAHAAVGVLNRVLHFHRISCADPYIHELSPAQALVIRAGWGEGEQVADGRWLHALELPWTAGSSRAPVARLPGRGSRTAALRPQERLAELLSARGAALLCEDLALRARQDLDQERVALSAIELDAAYAAALLELRGEGREDLAIRIAELDKLAAGVGAQARAALAGRHTRATAAQMTLAASSQGAGDAPEPPEQAPFTQAPDAPDAAHGEPNEEVIRHALERLEAALRARTAAGFRLR